MVRPSKPFWFMLSCSLMLCCVACSDSPLTSINPFYTEKDTIYEPSLVGEWSYTDVNGQTYLKVEECKPDPPTKQPDPEPTHWYKATISKRGEMSVWHAYLFKLGGVTFLDVSPDQSAIPYSILREFREYGLRLHGVFRVRLDGDALHLAEVIDRTVYRRVTDEHKTLSNGSTVLLQPTAEIQSILKSLGTSTDEYAPELSFTRAETRAHFSQLAALGSLGLCEELFQSHHWEAALPYCKQASDLAPGDTNARLKHAITLAGLDRGAEARTAISTMLDQCRRMASTGFWSGHCAELSDPDVQKYLDVLNSIGQSMLGASYFVDGHWAEAAQHFSKVREDDMDMELRFTWALSLKMIGKQKDALEVLQFAPPIADTNSTTPPKPSQKDLIRPLLVDYLAAKLDDAALENKWDDSTMGSDRSYYVACMRYARGDLRGAADIFKTMIDPDKVKDWPDFLAAVRLRQIDAELHKPSLKKASRKIVH
jgi:hypothetical protein